MTDHSSVIPPPLSESETRAALEAARALVAAGVPVFLAPPDPSVKIGFALPPGWQRSPLDETAIDRWRPGDALCAVMGHALDLVDIDERNGGDISFKALESAGLRPYTHAVAETPSGGLHLFITATGAGSHDNIRPGIDVKGGMPDGSSRGFAFIAPTVRVSKTTGEIRPYRWVNVPDAESISIESEGDDTGAGIADMVTAARSSTRAALSPEPVEDDPFGLSDPARAFTRAEAAAYYMPTYTAFREMRTPQDHGFNQALNRLAMMVGHFVPEFMSAEKAEAVLYAAAEHNRSVEFQGAKAVRSTIRSGLSAGMREPYALKNEAAPVAVEDAEAADQPSQDRADLLIGQLLTSTQLRELPNPKPLINGLIDQGSMSWIIGPSGSYKSFVVLDMAAHVALGRPWRGRRVERGTVIYIVAEGASGMKLRTAAWEDHHETVMDGVLFLPRPVQAKDDEAWAALVEVCRRVGPVWVILDTQARVTVGLDENDNSEMGVFIDRLGRINQVTGAAVTPVHHSGRNGLDARGASAIDGAQDAELRLERTGDLAVTIHLDKQKDQSDEGEIDLELLKVNEGKVDAETGRDLSSLVVVGVGAGGGRVPLRDWVDNAGPNQAEVLVTTLDHFGNAGGTKAEIRTAVAERRALAGWPPMAKSSFYTAFDALVAGERLLKIKGTQSWLPVSLSSIEKASLEAQAARTDWAEPADGLLDES